MTAQVPTPEQIEEIRARAAKATAGPWREMCMGSDGWKVLSGKEGGTARDRQPTVARVGYGTWEQDAANVEFIAHSRADVDTLLSAYDSVVAQRDRETELRRKAEAHAASLREYASSLSALLSASDAEVRAALSGPTGTPEPPADLYDSQSFRVENVRAPGQAVNERDRGARLTHIPTGVSITSTDRRSYLANLANARELVEAVLRHHAGTPEPKMHGDHEFRPGIDIENPGTPDPRWCNVCGEAAATEETTLEQHAAMREAAGELGARLRAGYDEQAAQDDTQTEESK